MRSILLFSLLGMTALGFLATWPSHTTAGPFFRPGWQRSWWGGRPGFSLTAAYYYRNSASYYPYSDYPYADYRTSPGFSTAQEAEQAPHPTGATVAPPDAGHIRLLVPDSFATVSFDGQVVSSVGTARDYGTPLLQPGLTYKYMVRISWGQGDHHMTQERAVDIARGQSVTVDFTSGGNAGHK